MSGSRKTKPAKPDFAAVFDRLRAILKPYERALVVGADSAKGYTLNSGKPYLGKELFFGGVRLGKGYVSFYLFPVYVCPELLKDVSPALKKRMQGKSCFNFSSVHEPLMRELAALTKRGLEAFRAREMV